MDAGTLSAFGAYMNLGYRLSFLPYHFSACPRTREVKSVAEPESKADPDSKTENDAGEKAWMFNDSRERRHLMCFLFIMVGIYQIFLITQTVGAFKDENIPMAKKLQVLYLTVIYVSMNLYNVLTISFWGETGTYLNAVLELGRQFKGNVKSQFLLQKTYKT